ncbi:MAG: hypothetical protein WCQ90_12225 [Deltaproteobacteria bacterium]
MTKLSKELSDLSKELEDSNEEFARLYGFLSEITHKIEYITTSVADIKKHFHIKD